MIKKDRLTKIRNRLLLIPDFSSKIQSKTGYSKSYVNYVLNPEDDRYSQKIINAAFELIKEDNDRIEQENKLLELTQTSVR